MKDELEKQLDEVRLSNPIVYGFLTSFERGFMSREEAILRAMLALHKQNEELTKEISRLIERSPFVVQFLENPLE